MGRCVCCDDPSPNPQTPTAAVLYVNAFALMPDSNSQTCTLWSQFDDWNARRRSVDRQNKQRVEHGTVKAGRTQYLDDVY